MSHHTNNRNKMVARMSPKKPGEIKKALAWSKRKAIGRIGQSVKESLFYVTPELRFFHHSYYPYKTMEEAVKYCGTSLCKDLIVVRRDIKTTRVA